MLKFLLFWLCTCFYAQIVYMSPFDYPAESMVRLGLPQIQPIARTQCTGIILNSAYILTHANCSSRYASDRVNVTIGFINTIVTENLNGTKIASVRLHVHNFQAASPDLYDMMLLELMDTYMQYDSYVHPAVLYFGDNFRVFQGHAFEECAMMGWLKNKTTFNFGFYMHSLATANVSVLPNTHCLTLFPNMQHILCVKSESPICNFELGSALVCGSHMKWVFMGYYTGHHECNSSQKTFVFKKYHFVSEWMNRTSNGVYALENDILEEKVMLGASRAGQERVNALLWLLGLSLWIYYKNLINS